MNLLESYLNNHITFSRNVLLSAVRLFEEQKIDDNKFNLFLDTIFLKENTHLNEHDIQKIFFSINNSLSHKFVNLSLKHNIFLNSQEFFNFLTENFDYYDKLPIHIKFYYVTEYFYVNKSLLNDIIEEIKFLLNKEYMNDSLFLVFQKLLFSSSMFINELDDFPIKNYLEFIKICFEKINFLKSFNFDSSTSIEEFLLCTLINYYPDTLKNDILKKEKYLQNSIYFNKETLYYFLISYNDFVIFNWIVDNLDKEYIENLQYEITIDSNNYDDKELENIQKMISNELDKRKLEEELKSF